MAATTPLLLNGMRLAPLVPDTVRATAPTLW